MGPGHGHADTCHTGSRVTGQQHAGMGDNGDVTRCCYMHSLFSSLAHTTSSFSSIELFQHLGDVIHLFCIFIWSSQICRHRVKWWAGGLGRTWCQAESRDGTNKGVAGDRCGLVTIKIQKLY